jgi:hypothetical protein
MDDEETNHGDVSIPDDVLPDIYSRRKKRAQGSADPLQYSDVPYKVRMQVIQIFDDALELYRPTQINTYEETYHFLTKFFRRELGVTKLWNVAREPDEFAQWFLGNPNLDQVIDALEIMARLINIMAGKALYGRTDELRSLIVEINARLLEAGVGYQFENGEIIEADSRYLHAEVVVPALELLSDERFAAANSEFMAAHKEFRQRNYEQCLVECGKSFESVIKVIAAERKWEVSPDAPARTLVAAVFANGLIPGFLESEFTGIRTVLESGVGTVRNKSGGHGAGTKVRVVPRHLAAFQLHQTAAAITLLAEAHAIQPL